MLEKDIKNTILYNNLDVEFAGEDPVVVIAVLEQYLKEFKMELKE